MHMELAIYSYSAMYSVHVRMPWRHASCSGERSRTHLQLHAALAACYKSGHICTAYLLLSIVRMHAYHRVCCYLLRVSAEYTYS